MEGDKKRKKPESVGRRRRKEVDMEQQPTEDEVDEFFAILRRMRVAVKYFENNNNNNVNIDNSVKLTGKNVPAALKTVVERREVGKAGVLDLNLVPDGENNSTSD